MMPKRLFHTIFQTRFFRSDGSSGGQSLDGSGGGQSLGGNGGGTSAMRERSTKGSLVMWRFFVFFISFFWKHLLAKIAISYHFRQQIIVFLEKIRSLRMLHSSPPWWPYTPSQ